MPDISYDAKRFLIDGRRVWLVSGSIDYARIPHGLWRDRLRLASQAGLNCVDIRVPWCLHEREPSAFDFEGDLNLRAFILMAADEGLYCIVRPGPYIGDGWDFGGLPAYLHSIEDRKGNGARVREDEPQFMAAVDRYLRALMQQIGDLQANAAEGGPIVLMQVEQRWYSHQPEGSSYLDRLMSMFRQHGVTVPMVNNNNLWQPIEGTIDTWNGDLDLPAMMRQLAVVQPDAPPMVMELGPEVALDTQPLSYRLAGLVGVGAQFNISPFIDGLGSGLSNSTSRTAAEAPINEAGQRSAMYFEAKRICTFASHFGHVLAAREGEQPPSVALDRHDHPVSLLHLHGGQGELIMLLKSEQDKTKQTGLMLPNGLSLRVPHADQCTAWVLLNTNLGGVATLDYTSLSPWALIDRQLLVVFGPAGAQGSISINGTHHTITVPAGNAPAIIEGDPIHIAVLNQKQLDAAYPTTSGLIIGCDGLDNAGTPRPLKGWGTQFLVDHNGQVKRKRVTAPRKPTAPKFGKWQALSLKPLVDGSAPSYQPIDGPTSMGALGQSFGYGWYRFGTEKAVNDSIRMGDGGDRLHVYNNAKLAGLLNSHAGMTSQASSPKLKLSGTTVVLADNMGRSAEGQGVGMDRKGLADHLYAVKPVKRSPPQRVKQPAGDPFVVGSMAFQQRAGIRPMSEALVWTVKPESRKPIIVELFSLVPGVISINDVPIRFLAGSAGQSVVHRLLLDPDDDGPLTSGKNTIKLELMQPLDNGPISSKTVACHLYQTIRRVTPQDGWAFSPWSLPSSDNANWRNLPKSPPSQPAWLRAFFEVKSLNAPLFFEPNGLSKGVAILNGHTLGRYWHQTREGKQVNPNHRLYLPEPWLKTDAPNELMLFDEHGRTPDKCRLMR